MDCIVRGVTKSQTRLSNFHFSRRETASVSQVHQDSKVAVGDLFVYFLSNMCIHVALGLFFSQRVEPRSGDIP